MYLRLITIAAQKVSLNLPKYNVDPSTHFRVGIHSIRNGADDIWFEIVGENNETKSYSHDAFYKHQPLDSNIEFPKLLNVYIKNDANNWTSISHIYFGLSDPKSWNTGSQRVLRDNHYAEGLQRLSKRNFSSPANRYSTVGFRLVQRP